MLTRLYRRVIWEIGKISLVNHWRERKLIDAWMLSGKIGPTPHPMKQANLRCLKRLYQVPTFVETGTCRADMLVALRRDFSTLYSVELSEELCRYSRQRCTEFPNVEIRQGDSATELGLICKGLRGRVLFWLDGHYSGGDTARGNEVSPIIAELNAIRMSSPIEPIIVIDDARLFKEGTGYPTIAEIFSHFEGWAEHMNVSIHDDAIIAIPEILVRGASR